MTYELIRKRVKMLKESEAMGASLSPRDHELIGLLAERDALVAEKQALPSEVKSLDDLFEIMNYALGALERIPEDFYAPIDDYVTEAFNCMDDAISLLKRELDYRDEMEATRKEGVD